MIHKAILAGTGTPRLRRSHQQHRHQKTLKKSNSEGPMATNDKDAALADGVPGSGFYSMTDADAGRNWVPPHAPSSPKPTPDDKKAEISNSQSTVAKGEKIDS